MHKRVYHEVCIDHVMAGIHEGDTIGVWAVVDNFPGSNTNSLLCLFALILKCHEIFAFGNVIIPFFCN